MTWDLPTVGLSAPTPRLIAYVSKETHTWIEKAAELFGHGAASIRWIPTDSRQQMDVGALEAQIKADRRDGHQPFLIVGTAGTVSTGAIDPLPEIAAISRANALWFHVDGAYGAPAAALPDASAEILGLREADSVALDPHKWLYAPLEAGCVLVRDAKHLLRAFAHRPAYYNFDAPGDDRSINYHEFGLQNSRGFRALKVWMALRQAGRSGYVRMISDDIALSRGLFDHAQAHPELEAVTQNLSITTFRYVPPDLSTADPLTETYLNALNETLLNRLQGGGKAFVSNARVQGKYVLRACIVNFRTTRADIEALPRIVAALGRTLDAEMRPDALRTAV